MDVEAELKALGTKLLALEGMIQTLAARKNSAVDGTVIERLEKQLADKGAEFDSLKNQFGELAAKLTAPPTTGGGSHVDVQPWWKFFGF